jgi:APA family basic amino acid/polyamine antiporter
VQNAFTATKVLTLLGVIALGLAFGDPGARAANLAAAPFAIDVGLVDALPLVAAAMVGALFSSTAWPNVTFTAAETRDPRHTVGRALVLGTMLVCTLYVATNMAYLNVLPLTGNSDGGDVAARGIQHATADRVGTAVVEHVAGGGWGPRLMALAVMVSTFGCANGLVLSGARVAFAMARDGLFFEAVSRIHPERRTPATALWLQGAIACTLALTGSYSDLLTMTAFTSLLFNMLTVAGLFVLRRRRPDLHRPYRTWGYPLLPAAFIAVSLFFLFFILKGDPRNSGMGLALTALGIPAYAWFRRRSTAAEPATVESKS